MSSATSSLRSSTTGHTGSGASSRTGQAGRSIRSIGSPTSNATSTCRWTLSWRGSASFGRATWRFLDGLGPEVLDRRGRHPALGEVTLRQLIATWTVHDLDHIAQIFAGLAGSRDALVGPWKAYAGILLRRDDPAAVPG